MDPKGKAPAPTPPYRRDAQKGYLLSVHFPHAGPEPFGQAPRSFLKGNSLDGSRAAFSLEAIGMEYGSDPPDSDDQSICDLDDPDDTYPFLTPAQSPIPVENPGPEAVLHRALVPAECTAPWVETHRVRRTTFISHPRKACMCIEIPRSQMLQERCPPE